MAIIQRKNATTVTQSILVFICGFSGAEAGVPGVCFPVSCWVFILSGKETKSRMNQKIAKSTIEAVIVIIYPMLISLVTQLECC